jgi:NTP pyrophosphatase (non-canonical NTP hydrolase)
MGEVAYSRNSSVVPSWHESSIEDALADDFLIELRDKVRQFARDRNWEQFHTPYNLAAALSIEASELLEQFLWKEGAPSQDLDPSRRESIGDEMADVLIYLVRLADVLSIDLEESSVRKLAKNGEKYPVALSSGRADKYTDLKG